MGLFSRGKERELTDQLNSISRQLDAVASSHVTQSTPRTFSARTSSKTRHFFNARTRSDETLRRCKLLKEKGGIYAAGLEKYATVANRNGSRLEGDDQQLVAMVQKRLESINMDKVIEHMINDAVFYGWSLQEFLMEGDKIVDLLQCDSETFDPEYDDHGRLTGFKQTIPGALGIKKQQPIEKGTVLYFSWKWLALKAWDEIDRDNKIIEGITVAIERHGFRKYHIRVGAAGEQVGEAVVRKVGQMFENLKYDNEITTLHDVIISPIDDNEMIGAKVYNDIYLQRYAAAIGVPEEILGLGRGSTEATAQVRMQAFYDDVGTLQKMAARAITMQLIDRITGRPGAVRWVFNDVSAEDDKVKADYIATLMRSNEIDPYAIITRQEARQYLGLKAEENADEQRAGGRPSDDGNEP